MKSRQRALLYAVCTLTLAGLSAAARAEVNVRVEMPKSNEIAGSVEPACQDGTPDTTKIIMQALGSAIDSYAIGAPVFSTALSIPGVSERAKVIFGVHNGKAVCQAVCVVIPAGASVTKEDACVTDSYGRKCGETAGHNNILIDYWGGVRAIGEGIEGDKKVVCSIFKNWSHDRSRTISWRVWY